MDIILNCISSDIPAMCKHKKKKKIMIMIVMMLIMLEMIAKVRSAITLELDTISFCFGVSETAEGRKC